MASYEAATVLFFVVYCKSTVLGLRKMESNFKNNYCIVIRSSNPMKQYARELIECGIESVDTQDQTTPMLWIVLY